MRAKPEVNAPSLEADVLDRRFEAVVFDWDGTAVPDRRSDARRARSLLEALLAHAMDVYVVSGTHVGNVDGQLQARPSGPGRLYLCLNRGSEVFRAGPDGVAVVHRREATTEEEAALSEAADLTVARLADRGLVTQIVSQRLNRRKIDLIPTPEWADPPKAKIDLLLDAVLARLRDAGIDGLPDVVATAVDAAREAGLEDPRVTSDAKHVEIGLTDKSDSARWAFTDLRCRGVGPGLALIAGDELGPLGGLPGSDSLMLVPEAERATVISVGVEPTGVPPGVTSLGGGPETFLAILEDQLRRRTERRPPEVDTDPAWSLSAEGFDPVLERVRQALFTLGDGTLGSGAIAIGSQSASRPVVVASGVYRGEGPASELLPCPPWQVVPFTVVDRTTLRRVLDMRSGVFHQHVRGPAGVVNALTFSSLAAPGTVALRAETTSSDSTEPTARGPFAGRGQPGGVLAAIDETISTNGTVRVERLGAYVADPRRMPEPAEAATSLDRARATGFDALLAAHRAAWAERWEGADIVIEGDTDLQRAVRFALFHLMASVASSGEAAVGARGLSGPGYLGHVFWDADVFVLPFLAATHPPAARAMLEYRVARLAMAETNAHGLGGAGARFPWESAATGADVTPRSYRDQAGRLRPIRNATSAEHIVADVAWGSATYEDWTGDDAYAGGPGRDLLVGTARWWASRIRIDEDGLGHVFGVIGPDEYHGPVDDNAYTNVMARWNLRRAARAPDRAVGEAERHRWLDLAGALVDGYDTATGLYEQFAGFYELEPLVVADIAERRPVDAQTVLGPERIVETQILKQADVLMLHHLVPEEVAPGSLEPNLDYYEPRTAHGSSLSPGIHAALLARAGRGSEALEQLRLTASIDLDDLTGSTAAGLHLATMGSLWQALVFGVIGARPTPDALHVDPSPLPGLAVEVNLRFRGTPVRVRADADGFSVVAERPTPVGVPGIGRHLVADERGLRVRRRDHGWDVTT